MNQRGWEVTGVNLRNPILANSQVFHSLQMGKKKKSHLSTSLQDQQADKSFNCWGCASLKFSDLDKSVGKSFLIQLSWFSYHSSRQASDI